MQWSTCDLYLSQNSSELVENSIKQNQSYLYPHLRCNQRNPESRGIVYFDPLKTSQCLSQTKFDPPMSKVEQLSHVRKLAIVICMTEACGMDGLAGIPRNVPPGEDLNGTLAIKYDQYQRIENLTFFDIVSRCSYC